MGYQTGNTSAADGLKRRASADQENGTASILPVVSHEISNQYPPAARKAAFQTRSISRSSINSSSQDYQISLSGLSASSWMENDSFDVLQHLHKHASTFGLDSIPSSGTSNFKNVECGNSKESPSQSDELLQGPAFLSRRKLHLSKAKLKAASNTSALLAGFAMVAMVEIQLNNSNNLNNSTNSACVNGALPKPLLISFAACTTLLVGVHMLALLISTCILPNMEAITSMHSLSLVHESPHEQMHVYIELAWGCSTILGILLFIIEVAILCWIQFYCILKEAAYVATAILVPFMILFTWFAISFYRRLAVHTYETRQTGIKELDELKQALEIKDDLAMRP